MEYYVIEKLEGRICPDCGKLYASHDIRKVTLGPVVQIDMSCEAGHKWSEFYNLTYSGFWFTGKHYDAAGNEISKGE